MAGIDRAQEGERFLAAQFAEDDAIGPHPQGGDQQVLRARIRFAQLAAHGDQADCVRMRDPQFLGILDQDQALGHGDFGEEGVEECGLARRGAARNQDVAARQHCIAQDRLGFV